jgi:hypothetical protein
MRIKTRTLSFLALIVSLAFFLTSSTSNPPNGRTGAPGDGLCSDANCHASAGSFTGNVMVSGLPAIVSPNATYSITVTVNDFSGNAAKAGFQLVALDNSANNMGMITGNAAVASTTVTNGRNYAEHDPAKNLSGTGTASWTFDWTAPNAPGEDITMYVAGNIANGQGNKTGDVIVTSTASTTVALPLAASINNSSDPSCNGTSDGEITVTVSEGIPDYSYLWSDGQTMMIATNLSAGTYTVTVTDSNGDTTTDMVTLNNPAPVSPSVNGGSFICGGECTTLSAGTFDSYLWSTGETTQSIEACEAGFYGVTVTVNVCDGEAGTTVDMSDLSLEMASSSEANCSSCDGGAVVSASGGAGSYTYAWSNGNTGTDVDDLCGGITTVSVTDGDGCVATLDVNIGNVSTLEIESLVTENPSCNGSTGTATVTATGGEQPYTYIWSDGSIGLTIPGLAGDHTVTVTDTDGCIIVGVATITEPALIDINIISVVPDFGNGGSILTEVTGGTGVLTYSWTNNGNEVSTELSPTELVFGEYILVATDVNGCFVTTTAIFVDDLTDIIDISLSSEISLFPNPARDEVNLRIEDMDNNDAQVIVMDTRGREISRQGLLEGNNRINTSLFAEGIYFFRVQIGERFIVKKVVVRK